MKKSAGRKQRREMARQNRRAAGKDKMKIHSYESSHQHLPKFNK
jgi:hypothetical protein